MTTKPIPFRKRARQLILQACRQRMLIIWSEKSRVPITRDQCLKILNDIAILASDQQLAKYIIKNQNLIFVAIPGVNNRAIYQFRQLIAEAQSMQQQKQNTT